MTSPSQVMIVGIWLVHKSQAIRNSFFHKLPTLTPRFNPFVVRINFDGFHQSFRSSCKVSNILKLNKIGFSKQEYRSLQVSCSHIFTFLKELEFCTFRLIFDHLNEWVFQSEKHMNWSHFHKLSNGLKRVPNGVF